MSPPVPQERQFSERQVASYERELNDILERHKMDMKSLELSCMTARQDLERSEWYTSLIVWPPCEGQLKGVSLDN